jgi:leukotriene-A4 hydrolase
MSRYKGNVDYLKLSSQIGWKHLEDDIAHFGSENGFTKLVWPLSGEDPDDAFSGVPYEKGFNLLMFLEGKVGTTEFEAFAKKYIDTFKFKTVSSEDFRNFFMQTFSTGPSADTVKTIDWDEIFYRPGLPLHIPDFSNSLSAEAESYAADWIAVESGSESSLECAPDSKLISHWSSQQTWYEYDRKYQRYVFELL